MKFIEKEKKMYEESKEDLFKRIKTLKNYGTGLAIVGLINMGVMMLPNIGLTNIILSGFVALITFVHASESYINAYIMEVYVGLKDWDRNGNVKKLGE